MIRDELMGLDLGLADGAAARAPAAAACGARLARLRFGLGQRSLLDAALLEAARQEVAGVRAAGLGVLAVVDSDLTVAPAGAGAFDERPYDMLARAWVEEMVANAAALAAALGPEVQLWELLPAPNAGQPARIAPARWAELVARLAQAIRAAAPGAEIVSGGLTSDELDDGVDYLREAARAGATTGAWPAGRPPVDHVGLTLAILPDGGAAEDAVDAAVRERADRLARALAQAITDGGEAPGLLVTGIGWDAARTGETVQARNLWSALDSLTTTRSVGGVVWTALQDDERGQVGLYRAEGLTPADRRATPPRP